jgi:transposase
MLEMSKTTSKRREKGMIKVAQYYLIKNYHEREGLSQREIAKKLNISRNTVKKYLSTESVPTSIHRKNQEGKRLGRKANEETQRVLPIIDAWLELDQQVWKKQRHTAARIYKRLVEEYDFKGSESNIRRIVHKRKALQKEVFIPLQFERGQHFQFDWGEADILLQGKPTRIYLFCMQLSVSRKRFVRAYAHEKQESFLDGFVHAFEYFGGVPARGMYDNLKTAVIKVMKGRERLEQETFQALQAHYLFRAEFCNVRSGNEKGQVESLVGKVRRNALVPLPHVQNFEELNTLLLDWCDKTAAHERVPYMNTTVQEEWVQEKKALHPLPAYRFEGCKLVECQVSKISTITFETNQYSVPCQYTDKKLLIKAFVHRVVIVDGHQVIAEHTRSYDRKQIHLQLDHYLEALLKKPRAIGDARVMQTSEVPQELRDFHQQMRHRYGAEGDRGFIRFLLLHRQVGMDMLIQVVKQADQMGIYRYEGLHDILQRLNGEIPHTKPLTKENVPVKLQAYRIPKTDPKRYNELIQGGNFS